MVNGGQIPPFGGAAFLLLLWVSSVLSVNEFRAGIIMVEDSVLPFKMEMVGPAIDMAMERAENQYGIRFKKFLKLYPTFCNAVFSAGAVSDLYHNHNVSVLIGPGCSGDITVCGKLATFYKLPLVSGVGDLVLDKETYPTFTRFSYSMEKQSVFFKAVMVHFKWRHMVIVYDTHDVLMRIQGTALKKAFVADPAFPRPYDIEFDTTKYPDYSGILDEARQQARVILFMTSGGDLRKYMLTAYDKGMTDKGDFAFITIELFQSEAWGDFSWKRGDERDVDAKKAFESLLFITLTVPAGPQWDNFSTEVMQRAQRDYNFTYEEEVNYFVGAFYDSVIYLALALNKTIEDGQDPYDGLRVAQKLWNSTFTGVMGDVYVDEIGDRIADYSLLDMTDTEKGEYTIVAKYFGSGNIFRMEPETPIHWPGTGSPPPDVPPCGFKGDAPECNNQTALIVLVSVLFGLLFLGAVIGTSIYRRIRFESDLSNMSWKVNIDDVIINKDPGMTSSTSRLSLAVSQASKAEASEDIEGQIYTTTGTYKGTLVAIRKVPIVKFDINRQVLLELKQVRSVHHGNLTRFVGASIGTRQVAILIEYCPKGSLQDILANDAIKLDWTFRNSLINDIVRGLCYLHDDSGIRVHGRLKSSNCVVDSRFVLKLTDYGLPSLYYYKATRESVFAGPEPDTPHVCFREKLWRAPELLDYDGPATPEGDVYSLGIILQEVVTRAEPYEVYDLSPQDIIKRVAAGENPPFRPSVERSLCAPQLYILMESCWVEEAEQRPAIGLVRTKLRAICRDAGRGNIMDNLLSRMEQYAENLELLVEDRTRAFLDEKKRSEELLYRVLPRSIAEQLKTGRPVQPEAYGCVSVYFSDIVGFTSLSAASTPLQVVDLLNDLYTCFDAIIDRFDVYKVETIGDAYMVASGLPVPNGNEHARQICWMALKLLEASLHFKIRHRPLDQLKLRIGIHSGPVVAGVVGLTMPRYCLFGDTVNTTSRMESNGEPYKIHISSDTKEILDAIGGFHIQVRGEVAMKGKGSMTTYWLLEEDQL